MNKFRLDKQQIGTLVERVRTLFWLSEDQLPILEREIIIYELEKEYKLINYDTRTPVNVDDEYFTIQELVRRYQKAFQNSKELSDEINNILSENSIHYMINQSSQRKYISSSVERKYRQIFLRVSKIEPEGKIIDDKKYLSSGETAEFLGISTKRLNWLRSANIITDFKKVECTGMPNLTYYHFIDELKQKRDEIYDLLISKFL